MTAYRLFWGILFSFSFLPSIYAEDLLDVRDHFSDPVPVIFDTDIGGDIDDAFALAILHTMMERKKCEILAVTISRCRGNALEYARLLNREYFHPWIPVAADLDSPANGPGHYSDQILDMKNEDGTPRYPWEAKPAEKPLPLLRRVLAEAKDNSVVWIQVGEATNAAALLESGPDEISPLTGRELAARKVRLLSVMGGAFGFQDPKWNKHCEHNIVFDIPAAKKVCAEWPGEIVFSGFETGDAIRLSVCGLQNDLKKPLPNILWDSYCAWCRSCGMKEPNHPRPSWDLTSVLFVLRPETERNYFTLSPRGRVTVLDDGRTPFTEDPNGKHRVFLTSPEQNIRVQEAFTNLIGEKHEVWLR